MVGWLGPFHDEIEEREDRYLIEPSVPELGVKIKGGLQLDLKTLKGSPGELALPTGIRGRLERWEKWTFPLRDGAIPPADATAWLALAKVRHRRSFRVLGERVEERPVSEAQLPGCTLELTEVTVDAERWWTLGLEACGEPHSVERVLRTTVDALFVGPPPDPIRLDPASSMSYARWLGTRAVDPSGRG